jgi:hypothetical protein
MILIPILAVVGGVSVLHHFMLRNITKQVEALEKQ